MRCFSSPGGLYRVYVFNAESPGMTLVGLPHSEISGYGCQHLTGAYRSVATSFIGSRRQGIHPAPLIVCAVPVAGFGLQSRAWDANVSVFLGTRTRTAVA